MAVSVDPPPELPLGDVETLVVSCNKDGMDRLRQGDIKAAFEQFKYAEAILLANQMEGDSTALLATTCNNLGCYYKKVGKFHGALGYLRRALKLEVELKADEVTLAGTHLNLCTVLSKLEKHDKALQHSLVALDMLNKKIETVDTQASEDDYTILSIAYHNVGLEREHMQQWDQATIAFRTGYEVAKRFLGESHALTVTLLNNSNAVLKKSKDLQEQPGCTGPKARSFQQAPESPSAVEEKPAEGTLGTVTLPPLVPKEKEGSKAPSKRATADAADFLRNEEMLWANFAAKTLHSTGPAIEDDLPKEGAEEEDPLDNDDAMARHPLNKAALVSMQDLGLILPTAYDQGLFRFQENRGMNTNHNVLAKAMNDHPKALMDIIDAEVDCEPSMSAPNDFRPNRSMKRSTRTAKVVRRTGVFNSTTFRDKVMEDRLRLAAGGKTATVQEQNAAASIIQITWRNWHKYLQENSEWITVTWICATMIQSHWRSYHVRRVKLDRMVTNIQKIVRGVLVRRAMRQHRAAVTIQKRVVGILTRMRMKKLNTAARNMQRLARGFLARRRYQRFFTFKVSKVICIERFVRARLAKKRIAEKREEAEQQRVLDKASIDLQRLYRGWKGRAVAFARYSDALQAKLEYDSATKIQSLFRARKARKRVDVMRDQRLKEMEAAATYLRKMWLGVQTRNQYLKLKKDFERAEKTIITIQRYTRGCLCRGRLWREAVEQEERVWAAIEIQRRWRGYRGRVRWENSLEQLWRREMAAAMLQRNLRGWVARAKIAKRKRKAAREEFEK
ncbi:ASPM, partial [Symbiodinium pilosum]